MYCVVLRRGAHVLIYDCVFVLFLHRTLLFSLNYFGARSLHSKLLMLRHLHSTQRSTRRIVSLSWCRHGTQPSAGFLGITTVEKAGESHLPSFGIGSLGHLANSSVISSQKDTVVHAAVSIKRNFSAESDFLPMTVDYRDRLYARGVLPGDRSSRERHGSNDETLVGRMIDRAMRPLFPEGYVDDLQVLVTCHAADGEADPTVLGMNAASCALLLSSAPWRGPVGCVRVGRIDGKLVVNPTVAQMKDSTLDLVYAGTVLRTVMYASKELPFAKALKQLLYDAL